MSQSAMLLEFDEYTFDPVAGILLRRGKRIPLEPRPARLLACLVERLWEAGTHVDFSEGLSYCVRQVRLAPAGGPRPRARLWAGLALAASLFALVAFVERRPNRHHELAQRIVGALHEAIWGD